MVDKCCICENDNNYDAGTSCLHGKLVCKSCKDELNEFDNSKLFKIILKPEYNKSLSERIEYVKCKDKKTLEECMKSVCIAPHSEYYGYREVKITEVNIEEFPEIATLEIKESDLK